MNFESVFFDNMIDETLFYSPRIEIKPVHLANGLFRAVCEQYTEARSQHQAIYSKGYPNSGIGGVDEQTRDVLNTLLSADGAVYRVAQVSSYTLSHLSHITGDIHDRKTGEWLCTVLRHNDGKGPSPALGLLRELLMQDKRQRSDEISTLTLPLTKSDTFLKDFKPKLPTPRPKSLEIDESGIFCDPLLYSIRKGFDCLAEHDQGIGRYGGKLDILRRLVIWGCFSIYLHLANSGNPDRNSRVPMLLYMVESSPSSLQESSIQSYHWVGRSIDRFLRSKIHTTVDKLAAEGSYGSWDTDADIRHQIETMEWKSSGGGMRQKEERIAKYTPQCLRFYESYLSDTANQGPREAFANAASDMMDQILSSSPRDVARALGTRIGLVPSSRQRTRKLYAPVPDLLEVLVRSSIPPKEQWTINELANYWATHYGLLFGALGDENDRLTKWGISAVDGSKFYKNTEALVDLLEMSGYARRYADGVVFVSGRE